MDETIDTLRAKRNARILAAQNACATEVVAAEAQFERDLDELFQHNHPILSRQDG